MSAQEQPESEREVGAEPEQHGQQHFGQSADAPEKKSNAGMLGSLGLLGVLLLKGKVYLFAALKGLSFLKLGWLFKSFYALRDAWDLLGALGSHFRSYRNRHDRGSRAGSLRCYEIQWVESKADDVHSFHRRLYRNGENAG